MILMNKSFLIAQLIAFYQVHVSQSVYWELTGFGYPDSDQFKLYGESGDIHIHQVDENSEKHGMISTDLSRLDRGEYDTILLYMKGNAEFIIIDDGKGARYCHDNRIPFINALLFPKILAMIGVISKSESMQKFNDISGNGRYSDKVIKKALDFTSSDLENFLPESP